MSISLEYVPEWAIHEKLIEGSRIHESYLSSSIETTTDVNNYLKTQWDFFKELFLVKEDKVFVNPLFYMGATDVKGMWGLMMSVKDLASPSTLYDPNRAEVMSLIQNELPRLDELSQANGQHTIDEVLHDPIDIEAKRTLKRYVKFTTDPKEKTLFINMTHCLDENLTGYVDLIPQGHAIPEEKYRINLIEAMFEFLRTTTSVNNSKGDAKYLLSRYPTLAWCYTYFISRD